MVDSVVYDKAKYHYEGKFPKDLPIEQAYVHTGMFLGWIIDANLHSKELQDECAQQIELFRKRKLSPVKIYVWWDGVLTDEMLNDEGNKFAHYYFDFSKGKFPTDYDEVLCAEVPTLYHVRDTWENYNKLKKRIDSRYEEWKLSL